MREVCWPVRLKDTRRTPQHIADRRQCLGLASLVLGAERCSGGQIAHERAQ